MARVAQDPRIALLSELLGRVEVRERFGAAGLYLRGTLFAVISDGRLFLRTDAGNRAAFDAFEIDDGSAALAPPGPTPAGPSYRPVPGPILDDPEHLRAWALKAWEAGKRAGKGRL